MKHYPEAIKFALIQKYLLQAHRSIRSIAREAGVGKSTLHEWVTDYRNRYNVPTHIPSHKWSSTYRLIALRDCDQLDEQGIGRYCRTHGIYRVHLEQWRQS